MTPVALDTLVPGAAAVAVSGVTLDARLVEPGDLFVGLPGRHHHGASFAAQAAAAGAVALLTDAAGADLAGGVLPLAVVDDARRAMAPVAARVYGEPACALTTYGITGTQGKTTTAYLLDAALRAAGTSTGLVGTVGFSLDGHDLGGSRTTVTTPESPELQGLLGHLVERGAQALVMEVSSHALVLGRVDAVVFDVAAFTGFGEDHLDFHGDVESYFEAKASLFTPERARHAVVNLDDERGPEIVRRARAAGLPVTTTGFGRDVDVHPVRMGPVDRGRSGLRVRVGDRELETWLPLPGEHNVRNALTALAMVAASGGDLGAAGRGLETASVPGRMQRVDLGDGAPAVFVDFAHTPQAVAAAVAALSDTHRVVVVLGAGGDRDPGKRRPMGHAAAWSADVVVVTDDNPRGEDPAAIRAEVLTGARSALGRAVEVVDGGDRRSAIATALALAGPDDAVLVLGKGHERGQEVAGVVHPFVDADVVREAWAARQQTTGEVAP
ncbi:UDP-N-acetylmuramoyl-L-alanyl-D-glutamate--2,6-diaminopimelate ligase [Microlunatus flavus]|uniref:UDP-N-acetylmuramoyl-L-alanyl-D-glutamate--2,6-diaminopimelate ligase n=1 Tax=Microlunatus flavus TaxID=1036181 RepID=A0A1H9HFM1_9ACTN|nr:UDP-N-acetylmuramoyl-L-alanyl-D-glutamate--2,6-diaminopimelate ligase [Microlunatus flavus]